LDFRFWITSRSSAQGFNGRRHCFGRVSFASQGADRPEFHFYILDFGFSTEVALRTFAALMNEQQFKDRTKGLALEVIKLVDELPRGRTTDILTGQLARAATSVASNYRAACRAKSTADLISKLGNVEEESDETGFWLEMLVDAKKVAMNRVAAMIREANEILAMTVASIKTLRARARSNPKSKN